MISLVSELGAFILIMALGQFSPGPDMILLTRTALAEGLKAGILTVLGIVTGLAVHACAALFGMAAIIAAGGWFAALIKVAAACYLIWLAIQLLRARGDAGEVKLSRHSPYYRGLFCNLLNPKVVIFFAGAVAPFLAHSSPVLLGLVIVGEGLLLWSLWVVLLQQEKIRGMYQKASRWIDRGFALGLIGLAWFTLYSLVSGTTS